MGRKRKSQKTYRVGIVTVEEAVTAQGEPHWRIEYRLPAAYPGDPNKGKRVRRRFRKDERTLAQLREMAEDISGLAYHGKGYVAAQGAHGAPAIEDGILEAVRLANTQERTRRERIRHALKFVEWLGAEYPHVKTWDVMKPAMLQAYVQSREDAGDAYDTVRLAVAPIKLAWRHMADNYPDAVRPLPRIKQKGRPPKDVSCLEAEAVSVLLAWLKEHERELWGMVVLQALAGLRMWEAAAVRRQDINPEKKTLHVTTTPTHSLKNEFSDRVLPLCTEAWNAICETLNDQKIVPAGGEIFTNTKGEPWTEEALKSRWRRFRTDLLTAPVDGEEEPRERTVARESVRLPARKLRSAFATMAMRLGCDDSLVRRYMGHTPTSTLARHYQKVTVDDLRPIADAMNRWRTIAKKSKARKTGS